MPFLIDDIFLRMLGISIPPFDLVWIMEVICDYANGVRGEETNKKINNKMKENRLLYELGEITREEYERRNGELNHQRKMNNRVSSLDLHHRINILG